MSTNCIQCRTCHSLQPQPSSTKPPHSLLPPPPQATPSPSPAIIEPPADGSSKHISTSSLFSRELGTISPLQIEVEVDGHRFSTLDPVGPLHSFNGVDQLGTSVQRTVSPAGSNPTPPPASSNSTSSSAATTPLSDRPSATLSSATGDVATHGQAETRRGLPLRRPGSLDATDQVGYLAGDVDEMTFEQKSRTLDNFSRKSKSRAAPPHGGTGSGGTLPGTYRSGRAPTHSAPKAPPAAPSERAGRRVSEDQGAVGYSKSSSVESGATAGVEFRAGSIKKVGSCTWMPWVRFPMATHAFFPLVVFILQFLPPVVNEVGAYLIPAKPERLQPCFRL